MTFRESYFSKEDLRKFYSQFLREVPFTHQVNVFLMKHVVSKKSELQNLSDDFRSSDI